MKKLAILVLILLLFAGVSTVFSQAEELSAELIGTLVGIMEADFELLLDGIGTDVDTILVQNAMAGQNIGMAEMGGEEEHFNHFYIGVPLGATVANGFLNFRNDPDYFEMLDLNVFLNEMAITKIEDKVAGTPFEDVLDKALNDFFPIPYVKLSVGFALPLDLEVLINGQFVPGTVTELLLKDTDELAGLSFGYLNIGGVVRYVLLRDGEDTPGASIGLGCYYNGLNFGMDIGEMMSGMMPPETGGVNPFESANISIGTSALTFGMDFSVSKRLAGFFIPYAKLGVWYGITNVGGNATLMADDPDTTTVNEEVALISEIGHNGIDLLLDAGFDFLLGPIGINLGGNYNLGTGIWGVNLGSRLQF